MRITLALDDDLVRAALTALIERETNRHLIHLGGSEPDARAPPR